jgi:hypothetical protein
MLFCQSLLTSLPHATFEFGAPNTETALPPQIVVLQEHAKRRVKMPNFLPKSPGPLLIRFAFVLGRSTRGSPTRSILWVGQEIVEVEAVFLGHRKGQHQWLVHALKAVVGVHGAEGEGNTRL